MRVVSFVCAAAAVMLSACSSAPEVRAAPAGTGPAGSTVQAGTTVARVVAGSSDAGQVDAAAVQHSDGRTIVVGRIGFADPGGFVVVYRDGGGAPGRRLGVSAFIDAQSVGEVTVTLNEPLPSGRNTVFVVLHRDGNLNGVFDGQDTDPPVTLTGGVVAARLSVTVDTDTSTGTAPAVPPQN